MAGIKFRRQKPIGKYIVDFVSFEEKIIVEVDGGQHNEQQLKDTERNAWLKGQGFFVLRFWNHEVLQHVEAVVAQIAEKAFTLPVPSHQGRGDR